MNYALKTVYIFLLLFLSCTSNVLSWDVMYVAGERERDKVIAQLKEKKARYVIEKRIEDIYEIRFKEEKNDLHK